MRWLVIEEAGGAWESVAIDYIEVVTWDGENTVYVKRKGMPPKGYEPRSIFLADEPVVKEPGRSVRSV